MEEVPPPQEVNVTALNSDWKVIKCLNWTGVVLAAVPPYNFGIQKFENLKVYQNYVIVLIAVTVFGFIYSLIGRQLNVYPNMNLTTVTMDVLSLLILTALNLIVLASSAFFTEDTNELMTCLIKNDMFLQRKQKKTSKGRQELEYRINVGLLNFTFLIIIILDSYVWCGVFGCQSLRYYFFKNFQFCIPIFVTLRFCEGLKFIANRFKFSTKVLIDLVNEMHKIPEENDQNTDAEAIAKQWVRVSQKIKPRQEDIMQLNLLTKIFETLFGSVELFNKIFEWQILFVILLAIMEVFQALNFFIACGSGVLLNKNFSNPFFIALRISWAVFLLILGISVIQQSVIFRYQIRNITMDIHKRLLEMPSEELLRDEAQEQLITLNQQFIHRALGINAPFFSLDFEFVANMFLTISSLTPVIVQFNRI